MKNATFLASLYEFHTLVPSKITCYKVATAFTYLQILKSYEKKNKIYTKSLWNNNSNITGHATILSRQRDLVFLPLICLLLQFYFICCGSSVKTPSRPKYFSNFFWSLTLYYVVAKLKIVPCPALNSNNILTRVARSFLKNVKERKECRILL